MKLKNTEYLQIKERKKGKRIGLLAGLSVTTLCLFYVAENNKEYASMDTTMNSEYNYYASIYLDALNEIANFSFDKNFVDIYRNGKFLYKDYEYSIDDLYVTKATDGNTYIVEAGEDNDFFTQKEIEVIKPIALKKSTLFWNAYQNKVFHDKNINLEEMLWKQYLQNWDGKKHQKVPELLAEDITKEQYAKELKERQNQKR